MSTIITSKGVSTGTVNTNALGLGQTTVNNITYDSKDRRATSLPASIALTDLVSDIVEYMPGGSGSGSNTWSSVFTASYVNKTFAPLVNDATKGWEVTGWTTSPSYTSITNKPTTGYVSNNKLAIPVGRVPKVGTYLLVVTASELPSGSAVDVYVNAERIQSLTTIGNHSIVVSITNTAVDKVFLTARGLGVNDTIKLSYTYYVGVQSELVDYVASTLQQALGNFQDAAVTPEELASVVATLRSDLEQQIASVNQRVTALSNQTTAINTQLTLFGGRLAVAETEIAKLPAIKASITTVANNLQAHLDHVNPHAQYVLRSELSDIVISDIITSAPLGDVAIGTTKLPLFISFPYLNHYADGPYDSTAGFIAGTYVNTVHRMVCTQYDYTDRLQTISDKSTIFYTFQKESYVTSIPVYFDTSVGIPTTFRIVTDDNITNVILADYTGYPVEGTIVKYVIPVTATTKYIRFDSFVGASVKFAFDVNFNMTNPSAFTINKDIVIATPTGRYTTTPISVPLPAQMDHDYVVMTTSASSGVLTDIHPSYGLGVSYALPFNSIYSSKVFGLPTGVLAPAYTGVAIPVSIGTTSHSHTLNKALPIQYISIETSTLVVGNISVVIDGQIIACELQPISSTSKFEYLAIVNRDVISYTILMDLVESTTVSKVNIAVNTPYYNLLTQTWSDGVSRKILGIIRKSKTGYGFIPYGIKNTTYIPVSGLDYVDLGEELIVPNPYRTEDISVEFTGNILDIKVQSDYITLYPGASQKDALIKISKL